jgi:hypothetical protein
MQKGFSAILILLGIIVLGALLTGTYYLGRQSIKPKEMIQKAHDSAMGDVDGPWHVYGHTEYKFEVQIPDSWMVDSEEGIVIFLPKAVDTHVNDNIRIQYFRLTSEQVKGMLEDAARECKEKANCTLQSLTVDGVPAYRTTYESDSPAQAFYDSVEFGKGDRWYSIRHDASPSYPQLENKKKIFNKIVNTFKFNDF